MPECPDSSGRAVGTQETCHLTSARRKGPHDCLSLGNIFIGSEITGLRRAGTGTELRRAARGFAPGQTCCVGSAGRLPGPPSQQWLGTWHLAPCMTSAGLALWPPCRRAPPFPVAGVVSLSQCRGGGPGWAPPRVQAGPFHQYILGSRRLRRGEASSGFSSPRLWELGSPGGALTASAGHHPDKLWEGTGEGREKAAVRAPAQGAAFKSPSDPCPLSTDTTPDFVLIPHIHSASSNSSAQQLAELSNLHI